MNLLKDFGDIAMHLDKYLGMVIQNYGLWSYLILFLVIFAIILFSILPGIIEFLRYRFTGNITKKMLLRLAERLSCLGEFGKYLVSGLIMAVLAMLLFSKLAEDLIYQELTVFDSMVTQFIAGFSTPVNTQIMKAITAFGSVAILLPVAIVVIYILYLRKKTFWDSVMVLVALGGGWLWEQLLKWFFHRPRPDVARLIEVSGYSFPSGHAMVSVAFYGFIAHLLWLNLRRSRFRHLVVLSLAILIVLIGISRIYLGVHYPSDVLAGFAAGVFWLVCCILAFQALRYYKAIGPVEIIFYNARRKG